MEQGECLRLEEDKYIASITLNRPQKHNAMSLSFFKQLGEICKQLDNKESIRVVVIKAEGKSFTAGLDLQDAAKLWQETNAKTRHDARVFILELQHSITALERLRKPVIAAMHGACLGGGIDLVCAADIRVASKDAVFSIKEVKLAIIPDLGTLQRIAGIVGQGWARELSLTGRDIDASMAYDIGFITHIYENYDQLLEGAYGIAKEIAELSPIAVQGVKETLNFSRDFGVSAGLEYVAQKNAALIPSKDLMEAFQAFFEKRVPKFTGK